MKNNGRSILCLHPHLLHAFRGVVCSIDRQTGQPDAMALMITRQGRPNLYTADQLTELENTPPPLGGNKAHHRYQAPLITEALDRIVQARLNGLTHLRGAALPLRNVSAPVAPCIMDHFKRRPDSALYARFYGLEMSDFGTPLAVMRRCDGQTALVASDTLNMACQAFSELSKSPAWGNLKPKRQRRLSREAELASEILPLMNDFMRISHPAKRGGRVTPDQAVTASPTFPPALRKAVADYLAQF